MTTDTADPKSAKGTQSFAGRAYHMREVMGDSVTWADIADAIGYRPDLARFLRADRLQGRARRYAARRGKPWPPQPKESAA